MIKTEPNKLMKTKFAKEHLIFTLYTYFICALVGIHILNFLIIYSGHTAGQLTTNLINRNYFQQYYILSVFIVSLLLLTTVIINPYIKNEMYGIKFGYLKYHLIVQFLFGIGLLVSQLSLKYGFHFNLLDLLNSLLALISLLLLSNGFYYASRDSWKSNSTRWGFFYSAVLIGYGFIINIGSIDLDLNDTAYILLFILLLELGRIVFRFRFLYLYNRDTHAVLRVILGKHLIYFGVRVIVGIFIPVVYILYGLLSEIQFIRLVGILLLLGEFMEKVLFVFIVSPVNPVSPDHKTGSG